MKILNILPATFLVCVLISPVAVAEAISFEGTPIAFDYHAASGRLAMQGMSWRDPAWVDVFDTHTGERIGRIEARYAPVSPRFSPDGQSILFFDAVGTIKLYDLATQVVQTLLMDESKEGVFPTWRADGKAVLFYQRPRNRVANPGVHLAQLAIGSEYATSLTEGERVLDIAPVFSPDGVHVLFLRLSGMGPQRTRTACLLDGTTRSVTPLLPDAPGDPEVNRFSWAPDGNHVLLLKTQSGADPARGPSTLHFVDTADGKPMWSVEEPLLDHAAYAPDGRSIIGISANQIMWLDSASGAVRRRVEIAETGPCKNDPTGPAIGLDSGDVLYLSESGSIHRVGEDGSITGVLKGRALPLPALTEEEYQVESADGLSVPVKRFIPRDPKPVAVMLIIGGPGARINPDIDPVLGALVDAGYEVIAPAYRGCNGHGPEHLAAGRGAWGADDVDDVIAAGLDWKTRFGQGRPLIIAGYSYGGYLTLLALAQPDGPWAKGVVLWPMISLQPPLAGALKTMIPEGDYDQVLAKRSPLQQAAHMTEPVLLLYGDLDGAATPEEVNTLTESIQSGGGSIETVIYKGDGHGLLLNRADALNRIRFFLDTAE